jgi:hypothetical protein
VHVSYLSGLAQWGVPRKHRIRMAKPPPPPTFKDKIAKVTDRLLSKHAKQALTDAGMQKWGINNLMRAAKRYNRWRYGEREKKHQKAYDRKLAELMEEHGGPGHYPPKIVMQDGWAIDTSMSLPGLDRLLDEAGQVARERAGKTHTDVQQPYFRNLMVYEDVMKYPSWLDFVTSPDVLATAIHYLKTIPVLSKTRPPGIRFMESNQNLDPNPPGAFSESQLFHLDLHDQPLVYVLVLIDDCTMECGPWHFLPASVSDRAIKALGYQKRGVRYRVTDEEMYSVIDPKEVQIFAYPKGTVLFIDSSRCFHYGSRLSYKPRLQMMYAYTSVTRCDFSQTFMPSFPYPVKKTDSRLRKMVLK